MIAGSVLNGLHLSWSQTNGVRVAWYHPEWWGRHPPVHPPVWHYRHRPERYPESYWWRTPRWSVVVGWAPQWAEWSEPIYYDYGTGGNVTYEDNRVYINGENVGTIDDYRNSAVELAAPSLPLSHADQTTVTSSEWLGLGTFALVVDGDTTVDPEHCFALQLAVNRDGIVSGEFMDPSVADQTFTVQGQVDPETQRVAFTITGLDDYVFETGIYNLTQDQTSLLVHDGEEEMHGYLLVRLEEPQN